MLLFRLDQTMQFGLLLVFVAIPFLEIALVIKVGQAIGFWLTVLLLVASASLGSYVIFQQGFQVLGRAIDSVNRGKPPLAPVVDGLFLFLAGALLIMPGFLSDIVGLALLVPVIRHRFAVWCLRRMIRSSEMRAFIFGERSQTRGSANGPGHAGHSPHFDTAARPTYTPDAADGPIIEGEFQRLGERTVDRDAARNRPPQG